MEYNFDENSLPKEIVTFAMSEIAEIMKDDGFKFLKSKSEIVKKSEKFTFKVYSQSNRRNSKGEFIEVMLHSAVCDNKDDIYYWGGLLAFSNAKQDVGRWQLYGRENYEQSMAEIGNIVSSHLLPFFRRFNDLPNFVEEVAENGFRAFGDTQVYDANYQIPIAFLSEYGTKPQMTMAFQHYIDRHILHFVKPNMKNAIALLKEGREVIKNGEKTYAEFAVKHDLDLVF